MYLRYYWLIPLLIYNCFFLFPFIVFLLPQPPHPLRFWLTSISFDSLDPIFLFQLCFMHYSLELYLISAWCFLVLQPLYNQPSDLPCYHENLRRWDSQTLSVVLIIATIMQRIEVKQNDLYLKNYYCYQASKVYLYLLPVYVKSDGNIVIVLFVTVFMTFKFFIQQFVGRLHWNICLVVHHIFDLDKWMFDMTCLEDYHY